MAATNTRERLRTASDDISIRAVPKPCPHRSSLPPGPFDRIPAMTLCVRAGIILALFAGAATAQRSRFIVVQKLSGTVGFYDSAGRHIADAKVGLHPHEMALSPDGRTLCVSDNGVVWMTENGAGENTVSENGARAGHD
jgi:hypothetical protein